MTSLKKLQNILNEQNIDAYIIPTSDYHLSEYISDYFKSRAYLSGFTGSAGTLLVLKDSAYLWTDGRYFIQAQNELKNSGIDLMKMGQPNVPDLNSFINKILINNAKVGFNGKLFSTSTILRLTEKSNKVFESNLDLIDLVWDSRPKLITNNIYRLHDEYSGQKFEDKTNNVRQKLTDLNADTHIITSLEEQAWLYNLRGSDVKNTPVFLAFSIITQDSVSLFIDINKLDTITKGYLLSNNVSLYQYDDFYDFILNIKESNILLDFNKTSFEIYKIVNSKNNIIKGSNPIDSLKAVKNDIEIKNTKTAHIKDGVSMVRFLSYLDKNYKNLDEEKAIKILSQMRSENATYIEDSFDTICAFKEHGAMMHYSTTKESNVSLNSDGFLLIDSGGHYLDGTTDITRTIAIGKITNKMKLHYTTILKSVINLSTAVFLKGMTGQNLDVLARGPIWKLLLDYKCGTGHGVGHVLSVHEGPNSFRWSSPNATLVPGMITTNEPGVYLENEYGIRLENELLCVYAGESEFGEFYKFDTITLCPFDLKAIDKTILNDEEKNWLNSYHENVYNTLSPFLNDEEKNWLKENTKKI